MSHVADQSPIGRVIESLKRVVWGRTDPRVRATWRFLLAWPLLPLVGALAGVVMPILGVSGLIPGGPVQGIIFLGILIVWARVIDRRPLSEYGVSASRTWLVHLVVGFIAVVGVWASWHVLASTLGWMQIEPSMTAPQESVLFGLGGSLASLGINTWVQDTVFFAIIIMSVAEGLHGRDVDPTRAVIGAWIVGILFFTAIHGTPTLFDAVGTAVGGAVFGLLYVQTGELALPIGVHWGASYAAGTIFVTPEMASQAPSVFAVTKSIPEVIGGGAPIFLYLGTYLVVAGWLKLTHGNVTIHSELAQWNGPNGKRVSWRGRLPEL